MASVIRRIFFGTALILVLVLLVASPLLIRSFIYHPFTIPSGAMKPTLFIGDYIFVSKSSYGYSRFSVPFSPNLFSGRIMASLPERGDVVVFRLPRDTSIDYVHRLIGLPGERIQMISGHLHINGQPVKREQIEDFVETEDGRATRTKRWRETLPNGVSHQTLDAIENGFYDNTPVYTVPAGHYFMMGDNRDNSSDSRVMSQVGFVPFENLIGRADLFFFSIDPNSGIREERIGIRIR